MNEVRKPTKEESKEFNEIDKKLDKVKKESVEQFKEKARISMQNKIFMKISDVDLEDAQKFKAWCDRYVEGKQFLGIKVMMLLMERIEPLLINFSRQLNDLDERLNMLENKPTETKLLIPKTQGKVLK